MKRSWSLVIVLLISVIFAATSIIISNCIIDAKINREVSSSEPISMTYQNETMQELQAINAKMDAFAFSLQQIGNYISLQQQSVKDMKDEILQVKNEQNASRQRDENSREDVYTIMIDRLSSQIKDIQNQLNQMEEEYTVINERFQEERLKIVQDLIDIVNQVNSNILANKHDSGQKDDDDSKEDSQPEHVHSFDQYGNCSDKTCMVHQEVEVFDLIDLKRAQANTDYYYHIDWGDTINFEIAYSFISTDDIEITLYSDADHMHEIPMERVGATYTAELSEFATYYIKVHTLTEGDVEIGID